MSLPPLPDVPVVRCRMIWNAPGPGETGVRFYLSYTGGGASGADLTTLAGDIESAWDAELTPLSTTGMSLVEVDCLDITSHSGAAGTWTGASNGTRSSSNIPAQICANVEYGIARRYRGGKPRGYWPFGTDTDFFSQAAWSDGFLTEVQDGITGFFETINGLSIGSLGTLQHVNLSYYQGFTNHTNTSGRARAVPTYKATATHDNVISYSPKAEFGSQRRRRTSTSP